MITCSVRIDRRHTPCPGTWRANLTDVHVFELDFAKGTVKDLMDVASEKCSIAKFELVALPQSVVLHQGLLSSYLINSEPKDGCVLYCMLTPAPKEKDTSTSGLFECGICSPIDIISPGNQCCATMFKTLRALVHDESLAKSLAQLPISELCGLLEVYDENGRVLKSDVAVKNGYVVCTLREEELPLALDSSFSACLLGRRLNKFVLPPCCEKHTPEQHDLENQYVRFCTRGESESKSEGKVKVDTSGAAAAAHMFSGLQSQVLKSRGAPASIIALLGVWLGRGESAQNHEFLSANNIYVILNVADDVPNFFQNDPNYSYCNLSVSDFGQDQGISRVFQAAENFVRYHQSTEDSSHSQILIHCANGSNRSATVCLALMMTMLDMNLKTAWSEALRCRPNIFPLKDNQRELMKYEREIFNVATSSMKEEDFDRIKRQIRREMIMSKA